MPDLLFLRELLVSCVSYLQLLLETISVICVVIGLGKTLVILIKVKQGRAARYCFGNWLATALEFQLAADILVTTVDPDLDSLIKLGIIAVIRTFLNYFLSKELEHNPNETDAEIKKAV
ncbi:DUF1622 domain-containing protein [Citrobacter sp. JGM124]|uniref:DUF1622 domain-containing protein n=1 Tax=Citrobacter sp. JGM124 TaxID=2799789 RepID=UPI001BA899C5|nr:DUF1622 domain-containing protein [Citrobacter sp. JGM124]MBS0849310.1 DUF1622 domain-containing protein [Citrobacter sp. JGM124]